MNRWLVFCLLLSPWLVVAADAPSLELLEFLGDWETAEGEWQDPLEFMQDIETLDVETQNANIEDAQDGQ